MVMSLTFEKTFCLLEAGRLAWVAWSIHCEEYMTNPKYNKAGFHFYDLNSCYSFLIIFKTFLNPLRPQANCINIARVVPAHVKLVSNRENTKVP